jgi:hypothetical protein
VRDTAASATTITGECRITARRDCGDAVNAGGLKGPAFPTVRKPVEIE